METTDQGTRPSVARLLERGYAATAGVMAAIPPHRLDAPSPCADWTVRQVADHLVGALDLFARIAEGQDIDPAEFGPGGPRPDHLGSVPGAAYRAAAERCAAAFRRPGALEQVFPFAFGPTPGLVIANISLSESLVHGWDLARGAGVPYAPDDAVVDTVLEFASRNDGDEQHRDGMFGPVQQTAPDAPPFTALLGFLGRRA